MKQISSILLFLLLLLLCSCHSKEVLTKENTSTILEDSVVKKDSIIRDSNTSVVDTSYNNENIHIHEIVYSGKTDSAGHNVILKETYTDISKNTSNKKITNKKTNTLEVNNTQAKINKKTVSNKETKAKTTSDVKSVSHLVRNIIILVVVIVFVAVLYKKRFINRFKK